MLNAYEIHSALGELEIYFSSLGSADSDANDARSALRTLEYEFQNRPRVRDKGFNDETPRTSHELECVETLRQTEKIRKAILRGDGVTGLYLCKKVREICQQIWPNDSQFVNV